MLKLRNEKRNYEINLPTNFKEINFDALVDVVKNVKISEHYAMIALCQSFNPFNLALLGTKQGKDINVAVSANFIKSNDPNNKVPAKAGDKIVISRTDLELSTHISIKFGLSTSSIGATIEENPSVATMLRNGPVDDNGNPVKEVIAVEFKLVPLTAIKAVIDNDITTTDIYRSTIKGS